jgi:hypothetical protein
MHAPQSPCREARRTRARRTIPARHGHHFETWRGAIASREWDRANSFCRRPGSFLSPASRCAWGSRRHCECTPEHAALNLSRLHALVKHPPPAARHASCADPAMRLHASRLQRTGLSFKIALSRSTRSSVRTVDDGSTRATLESTGPPRRDRQCIDSGSRDRRMTAHGTCPARRDQPHPTPRRLRGDDLPCRSALPVPIRGFGSRSVRRGASGPIPQGD